MPRGEAGGPSGDGLWTRGGGGAQNPRPDRGGAMDLLKIFQSLEDLAIEIALWFLLVPKTA